MDSNQTTRRMVGLVMLILVAALLLAWLLKPLKKEETVYLENNTTAFTDASKEKFRILLECDSSGLCKQLKLPTVTVR